MHGRPIGNRMAFFFGEKTEDGYFPVSITGIGRQPVERGVNRFSVYTLGGAYYFAETDELISAVFAFVDTRKRVCFTTYIKNKSDKDIDTYLSAYFEPHMLHDGAKDFENKWYRSSRKFLVNGRPYASENGVLNLTDTRGKEDITITVVD